MEVVGEADLPLLLLQLGVVELDDPAALGAHHVVVPLAGGDPLVHVVLAAQTRLAGKAALDEEVQRAVDGGAGNPLVAFEKLDEEGVRVEMPGVLNSSSRRVSRSLVTLRLFSRRYRMKTFSTRFTGASRPTAPAPGSRCNLVALSAKVKVAALLRRCRPCEWCRPPPPPLSTTRVGVKISAATRPEA